MTYDIYGNGAVLVDLHLDCFGDLPPLPRLGLSLVVPTGFEAFTWLGGGPHESYVDRKAGAAVGLYGGTVDEQYVPYIMPQENGNKTDVRWAALSNAQGLGLLAIAEPHMEASVSHYSIDMLYRARHTNELAPRTGDLFQPGFNAMRPGRRILRTGYAGQIPGVAWRMAVYGSLPPVRQ